MRHQTNITQGRIRYWKCWLLTILFLFLSLVVLAPLVWAQNEPGWIVSSDSEASISDLKEYLSNKYVIKELGSYVRPSEYGTSRSLHIRGNLTPKKSITDGEGEHNRARAIAKSFLKEEASHLFGIANLADVREFEIFEQSNWTYIVYNQYVGDLPLSGAIIQMQIAPDESISSVDAYLEPVTSKLLQALSLKTLSDAEIRRIVEADIKATSQSLETEPIDFEKFASPSPPYVIWKAYGDWEYTIDAFTGHILKKLPNRFEFRQLTKGG